MMECTRVVRGRCLAQGGRRESVSVWTSQLKLWRSGSFTDKSAATEGHSGSVLSLGSLCPHMVTFFLGRAVRSRAGQCSLTPKVIYPLCSLLGAIFVMFCVGNWLWWARTGCGGPLVAPGRAVAVPLPYTRTGVRAAGVQACGLLIVSAWSSSCADPVLWCAPKEVRYKPFIP